MYTATYCYETAAAGYVPEGYGKVLAGFLEGMNWIQTASGIQEGFGWLPCPRGFRCMTTVCQLFAFSGIWYGNFAKDWRKFRESRAKAPTSKVHGVPLSMNTTNAKNEANQAHAKTIISSN